MKMYEYDISMHPTEQFNKVVYFCTERGECSLSDVPTQQVDLLASILRARGQEGWELVQIFFGTDGAVAFWKREAA